MGGSTSKDDCIEAGFFQDNNKYGNIDTGMKIFDFHGKGLFTFTLGMLFGALVTCTIIVIKNRLCPYTHHASGVSRRKYRSRSDSYDDDEPRERRRRPPWSQVTYADERARYMPPAYALPSQTIWAPARFSDVTNQSVPAQNTQTISPPDPSNPPPSLNNGTSAT